jgi:hypothetical protein
VVLRDLEKTLTNEAANSLRDRIYLAIHQGTEYQWAHQGATGRRVSVSWPAGGSFIMSADHLASGSGRF